MALDPTPRSRLGWRTTRVKLAVAERKRRTEHSLDWSSFKMGLADRMFGGGSGDSFWDLPQKLVGIGAVRTPESPRRHSSTAIRTAAERFSSRTQPSSSECSSSVKDRLSG